MATTERREHVRVPWYRVPVLWLGLAVFAASIAGSVWLVRVSSQYRDEPVTASPHAVFGVPVRPHPAPASS